MKEDIKDAEKDYRRSADADGRHGCRCRRLPVCEYGHVQGVAGEGEKVRYRRYPGSRRIRKHHFKGSLETNAYPVKSEEERKKLDKTLERINASQDDVVIVCPRGGGGAKNTYDYLKEKGVEEKRLFILEKGMEGWPHPEMCVQGR